MKLSKLLRQKKGRALLVQVVWHDAESHAGWQLEAELSLWGGKKVVCTQTGWLREVNKHNIVLFGGWNRHDRSSGFKIPLGCVKKVYVIQAKHKRCRKWRKL